MKVYKIKNLDDYRKVFLSTLETGQVDYLGTSEPLFDSVQELFDFFKIKDEELEELYDDDGSPIWDDTKEDLPKEWLDKWLIKDLKNEEVIFPFYLVVSGDTDYDRGARVGYRTFHVLQRLEEL